MVAEAFIYIYIIGTKTAHQLQLCRSSSSARSGDEGASAAERDDEAAESTL